ncbi:MAG: DUF7711 family protein [Egibacteraceae bacterium]
MMMRYATAVGHLRRVADACQKLFTFHEDPLCVGAYVYGELLEGPDRLECASVAFALGRSPEEVPSGFEPREMLGFMEVSGLVKIPLRWCCRSAAGPLADHEIHGPVRFWSPAGVDEEVLRALAERRFDDVVREPDPDPAQADADLARALAHLHAVVDSFWEPDWRRAHMGGGVYPEQHLWNAARRCLDLLEPPSGAPQARQVPDPFPWAGEALEELRAAIHRGDGRAVVVAGRDRPTEPVLQLVGDGLLAALAQEVPGVTEAARECVAALRKRFWDGDDHLADQLDAALGRGAVPALRAVPVDLAALADHLDQGGEFAEPARLNLRTGELWPVSLDLDTEFDDEDEDVLRVERGESHEAYRDMQDFLDSAGPQLQRLLDDALSGPGPFRRFRDVLAGYPEERERWHAFSEERSRGRARSWLAAEGYRPTPRRR